MKAMNEVSSFVDETKWRQENNAKIVISMRSR